MSSSIKRASYRQSVALSTAVFCAAVVVLSTQTLASSSQELTNKQLIENASTAAPQALPAGTGSTPAPVSTGGLSGPAVTGSVTQMALDGHEDR